MAILTVGNGKTHATIGAAITAASDTDTIEIFEEDAFGGRVYIDEGRVVVSKELILKSDTKGARNTIVALKIGVNKTITIADFHVVGRAGGSDAALEIDSNHTSTTIIVERTVITGQADSLISIGGTGNTQINNCIFIGGITSAIRTAGTGGTVIVSFATVAFADVGLNDVGTMTNTANNVLTYACKTDFSGTWGGTNNASTEAIGVPGSNPVVSITKAQAGFAYHNSPASGTLFPFDFRSIEAEMAASGIKDAGAVVGGIDEDIDGRDRDDSTPNIGASEGFTGFGSGVPPKPDGVVISDPITNGDLTITWTNSGSYIADDIMVAHDKDASNAILGGGDATAGTMTISKLTNGQQKNILLRAVRP